MRDAASETMTKCGILLGQGTPLQSGRPDANRFTSGSEAITCLSRCGVAALHSAASWSTESGPAARSVGHYRVVSRGEMVRKPFTA